ncbi:MAG: methyltransferase domain-containing protein [Nitrososphaera sp.]|uniref:methyltransferase domain-containing protein n=1 Tax=Nitrososphaera sp. TaxID=1971748 RepID=UPI003D6EAFB5
MLVHAGHASARKFFTPSTAPSYDAVVGITTFGRDAAWKREILKVVSGHGPVLDLACGTGILTSMIRETGRPVAGLDFTRDYLEIAKDKMGPLFAQGTAEVLPYRDGTFDAVVSSYLAKYVDVSLMVCECLRVLKPGGIVVLHDFACPGGAMRSLWNAYFAALRLAGTFARSWKPVFDGLDSVICQSRWEEQAIDAMQKCGFQGVAGRHLTLGTAAIVVGRKP